MGSRDARIRMIGIIMRITMVEGGEGMRGDSFGVRSIDDEDKDFMIPFCRGPGCRGHESMTFIFLFLFLVVFFSVLPRTSKEYIP